MLPLPICAAALALVHNAPFLSSASASRSSPISALSIPKTQDTLSGMYHARWSERQSQVDSQTGSAADLNAADTIATALGALVGVGVMSGIGAHKSIAMTPSSISMINDAWGGGAADISSYLDQVR